MTITGIQPVNWEPQPIEGTVDTTSEAVADWMNTNGVTDLTQLSAAQIEGLITHLKSLSAQGNIPGLDALITDLENAQRSHASAGGTEVEQFAADLKMRAAVLTELGQVSGGENNPFTKAAESLQEPILALDQLILDIDSALVAWSTDPAAVKAQMQSLIDQINNLKAAGIPTAELGLDALATDLQAAIRSYDATIAVVPATDEMKTTLALSNLREAFGAAKVEFFTATGTGTGSDIASAQASERSEVLRQRSLLSPTEDTTAKPENVSIESIDTALSDLDLQYQMAVSEGNTDAMKHIEAKMEILTRTGKMLESGHDPLFAGLVMFQGLVVLDVTANKVTQARLREQIVELQKLNDPALEPQIAEIAGQADALNTENDALVKMAQQVQDQFESVINMLTQTTNEALSKAM